MLRQLKADDEHSFLVVDHSLKDLANAAASLVKTHRERVYFLRSDAMFSCVVVLPRASADIVIAPMPSPFWSERGSHRRLVNCEFLCAVHRILRPRCSVDDARGFVAFTDAEPYADFILEQLEESKLIVPWARKKPQEVYGRWLPLSSPQREFQQQRFNDVVAIAASKSDNTTEQALRLIEGYDFKRSRYRSFSGE